jgi:putative membrane protein
VSPTVATDAVREGDVPADTRDTTPWLRLDPRVVWVDLARSLLSAVPAVLAVVLGVEPTGASLWPFLLAGAWALVSAVGDAVRWTFTRYRVTSEHVERRTGVLVRRYRSVRRDRIRSIDVTARARHRVAGLRVVLVGAGQQVSGGESALSLDALHRRDADALRRLLLAPHPGQDAAAPEASATGEAGPDDTPAALDPVDPAGTEVLARLRPWWVVHNMPGVWGVVTAAGLLWGAYWLASAFGIDLADHALDLAGPDRLGTTGSVVVAVTGTVALGAVGMGVAFLVTSWRFELARVPGPQGTRLRTRAGLLTTREVDRDEGRLRGITISEPVLWRWMGMADTQVVTTGLSLWAMSQPAAILPRGPVTEARRVAGRVLGGAPGPLETPLVAHPAGALRRRLWWATVAAAVLTAVLGRLVARGVLPSWTPWGGAAAWLLGLLGALVAYRALGHAISGSYLVVRSGLVARSTTALRRDAVSTIVVRESLLQRRLGLRTVVAATSAGWGAYDAPDLAADDALRFADAAAPGLLGPFLEPDRSRR